MARARLLVDRTVSTGNLWNDPMSTISASSATTALPAAATQNPDRRYVWRSEMRTDEPYLRLDLGSTKAFNFVAVANVKIPGTGVCYLQQLGTGGAPGAAVDVAALPAMDESRKIAFVFFGSQSQRHVQLYFSNPTVTNDYAEVGYVALGTYFEPGSNFSVPVQLPQQDPSTARVSEGGQKSFIQRDPYMAGALTFEDLLEADFDALQDIHDLVRIGTPFFLVLDTARAWMNYLARFTGFVPEQAMSPGRVSLNLGFEEAL